MVSRVSVLDGEVSGHTQYVRPETPPAASSTYPDFLSLFHTGSITANGASHTETVKEAAWIENERKMWLARAS